MRNFINVIALMTLTLGMVLPGCTTRNVPSPTDVSFISEYTPIEFTFPPGWYVNPEDNPYDLQCFSKSQNMNTGVFAYKTVDIATDSKPIDVFWEQVNDIKSKRRNVEDWEPVQTDEHNDKTVTSITIAGDKNSSRYCYRFSLIEFKTDASKFAVVLQVAIPGEWKKSKPVLAKITQSAKPLADPNDGPAEDDPAEETPAE